MGIIALIIVVLILAIVFKDAAIMTLMFIFRLLVIALTFTAMSIGIISAWVDGFIEGFKAGK